MVVWAAVRTPAATQVALFGHIFLRGSRCVSTPREFSSRGSNMPYPNRCLGEVLSSQKEERQKKSGLPLS